MFSDQSEFARSSAPLPQEVGEILFDTLPDALLLLSRDGEIVRRNAAAEALKRDIARIIGEARSDVPQVMRSGEGGWMEVTALPMEAGFLIRIKDVTALRTAEESIRRRDERSKLVLRSTNDILWWADPAKGFVEHQEAWEDFTGQTFDQYKHWGHVAAIHPDDRGYVQAAWAEAATEKRVCRCEYRVYCPAKGEYRHCMAKGVPMLGEDGEIQEWIGTLTDIHDLKAVQAELAVLNRSLEVRVQERTEDLNRALRDLESLTHTCSHDLRNGVRSVLSNCHFLREACPNLEEEPNAIVDRIASNALHLSRLVDDLLAFARLKREPILPQMVNLTRVAEAAVCDVQNVVGQQFQFKVARGMYVRADEAMLRRALACLIDNAVKFSPEGGVVEIGLHAGRTSRAIFVRDEGIGFEPEFAHRAMMPFERLHNDERFPGTGIGLAMVSWIADRHGGQVTATSAPGQGTTVQLVLPAVPSTEDLAPINRRLQAR